MKDVGTQCEEDQPALDIQESVHLVAISHGQGAIEAMMRYYYKMLMKTEE